jgi:nitrogen fixation/metabolism regulation signal transduction histidine kinase
MARQVAHEVKNPLTPIQLAAQMVRQACHDDHPRKEQIVDDSVDQIERQVQRLREIASEFSLLGRPDLPELEAVELGDLLHEVLLLYPSPDGRHELRIHGGEGLHVLANREAMLKILTNLVENAWQAMGETGKVEITASVAGEKIQLAVVDEGPGISPEAEERLFDAYFSTKSYGTGLGLVICRNLTEKMGGRIHLANRSDHQGAVAVVELPRYYPTQG